VCTVDVIGMGNVGVVGGSGGCSGSSSTGSSNPTPMVVMTILPTIHPNRKLEWGMSRCMKSRMCDLWECGWGWWWYRTGSRPSVVVVWCNNAVGEG
jgi:hypothetical protein